MSREHRTIPVMRESSAAARDCPLAPPGDASVQSRALHRACLIVGGIDKLAAYLNVPEGELRRWMNGEVLPPEPTFLAAVEVVLLYAANKGQAS